MVMLRLKIIYKRTISVSKLWNLNFWKSSGVKSFTGIWRIPVMSHRRRSMRLLITESIGVLIPSSSFRDLLKKTEKPEKINPKISVTDFREKSKFLEIQKILLWEFDRYEMGVSVCVYGFLLFFARLDSWTREGGLLYKYLM